jgi:ribonuclease HI
MSNTYVLYSDGGARSNPGPAACAAFLYDANGELVKAGGEYLGSNTNNYAEYRGLIFGLKMAKEQDIGNLKCHLDSELVVMQVNGAYRVKEPTLKELWQQVESLKAQFAEIKFVHVRREANKEADRMVNEILDAAAAA